MASHRSAPAPRLGLHKAPFRRAYDLASARLLFIDAWPDAWRAQAPPTTLVWLNEGEMRALGSQILGFRHWFVPVSTAGWGDLPARLAAAMREQAPACFVRLTSRSSKDSLRAMRHGLCVRSSTEALALMLEGSERVAHDLRICLDARVPLAIAVRPWLGFKPWQEWRCFMRRRRWAGASPQLGLNAPNAALALANEAPLNEVLPRAVAALACAATVDDVAFDLVVSPAADGSGTWHWRLLDANPLNLQTGLGWFASIDQLDERIRFG